MHNETWFLLCRYSCVNMLCHRHPLGIESMQYVVIWSRINNDLR